MKNVKRHFPHEVKKYPHACRKCVNGKSILAGKKVFYICKKKQGVFPASAKFQNCKYFR